MATNYTLLSEANMGVNFDKLALESYDRMTCFDLSDQSVVFMADDLKDFTLSQGADRSYQTGRLGARLSAMDRNKTVSGSGNNGFILCNMLAAQLGAEVETASASNVFAVPHIEYLTVATGGTSVTLSYDAVGMTGAEFPYIYKANTDMTQGAKYAIAADASVTEFKYEPATKTITLPTGVFSAGDVVIVPYNRKAEVGKKISNVSDHQSKTCKIVLDLTAHDVCDDSIKYHVVIVVHVAKLNGAFDLASADEGMSHPISFDALVNQCSATKSLWDMYIA